MGWGGGSGGGWGLGTKAPVSLTHTVPERKQIPPKSQFLSPLHAQTPSGTRRKSGVQGACLRLQRQPWPSAWYSVARELWEGGAGEERAGRGLGGSVQGAR